MYVGLKMIKTATSADGLQWYLWQKVKIFKVGVEHLFIFECQLSAYFSTIFIDYVNSYFSTYET